MKYGLFAALAVAFVALIGGAASAGVATSGVTSLSTAAAASKVQHVGWRCYRRCRWHGHSRWYCRRRCY